MVTIYAMAVRYNYRLELQWFLEEEARDTHVQFAEQVHRDGYIQTFSFEYKVETYEPAELYLATAFRFYTDARFALKAGKIELKPLE